MTELVEIGRNITLLRVKQNLTQEEVAFRSRLSVTRLQILEYGCRNTTVDTLIRIAGTLGIDSRVFAIFSRPDRVILSEYRQAPRLPEREGGALQICENISLLRKAERLTQQQLADRSGISAACLRGIEHGCSNVSVYKLSCIAGAFGLSLAELTSCTMSEAKLMKMVDTARGRARLR